MRCTGGEGDNASGDTRPRPPQFAAWIESAAAVLARESAVVGARTAMLVRLERFGLAITGEPLFELKPERT